MNGVCCFHSLGKFVMSINVIIPSHICILQKTRDVVADHEFISQFSNIEENITYCTLESKITPNAP